MVFFFSVDFVLGRTVDRVAWKFPVYLPIQSFEKTKKGAKGKLQYCVFFRRILAVKEVVYQWHNEMFRLYERYCRQASITDIYWGDSDYSSAEEESEEVIAADETNEADCDDGF